MENTSFYQSIHQHRLIQIQMLQLVGWQPVTAIPASLTKLWFVTPSSCSTHYTHHGI